MTATLNGRKFTGAPDRPPKRGGIGKVWLFYLILIFFAMVYLFPFILQIGTAFKTDPDASAHSLNPLPTTWTLAAFRQLSQVDFPLWFTNSVIVTVSVTIGRVFFDSLAGYALARLHFRGRAAIGSTFIAIMAVPGVVLLIPKYLVLVQLHLYDTYFGMIIPLLVDAAGIFIMRQFFINIPGEVEEAARIDGASVFRIFWSVALPMARPAVITLTILSFQGSWNELSQFIVATQNPKLYTLTKGLATLASGSLGSGNQFPLKMAAALVATIPVAIVFFIFQRQFVQGAGAGAVKG